MVGDWDPIENARMLSEVTAERIRNLRVPYNKTTGTARAKAAAWLHDLPNYDPYASEDKWFKLATRAWFRLQAKRVPNARGKLALSAVAYPAHQMESFSHSNRTQWEIVRALVAAKAFEMRRGRLPSSLEELVETGLIKEAPMDFYTGQPLRYDPAKRLIWSIWANGVDDRGAMGMRTGTHHADDVSVTVP